MLAKPRMRAMSVAIHLFVVSTFWALPNVYVSAHSSVSVDRYLDDVLDLFADNVARYVRGESLRNRVDMEALGFR